MDFGNAYRAWKINGFRKIWNWYINKREFRQRKTVLKSYPISVDIEVTNKCPLRCMHCPRSYRDVNTIDMPQGTLSLDNFDEIIGKLKYVRRLTLQGLGEPLLNPDIFKMIEHARRKKFLVTFSTSAAYSNREIEDNFRKCSPDYLTFSIDSMEKNSFEAIRVNHNFEKFVANVEGIVAAVKESGYPTEIMFHCCVMPGNLPYLDKVVEFADKLKISRVDFSELNLSYLESAQDKLVIGNDDYKYIEKALDLAKQKNIESGFSRQYNIKRKGEVICKYLWQSPYITWDGYVNICCGRPFSSVYNVGNIFQEKSFMNIWNNAKMQELRKAIGNDNVPPVCSRCPMAE